MLRAISVLPAPESPHKPTTSPARMENEMSWKNPYLHRCSARKTSSPKRVLTPVYISSTVCPTISSASFSALTSPMP